MKWDKAWNVVCSMITISFPNLPSKNDEHLWDMETFEEELPRHALLIKNIAEISL